MMSRLLLLGLQEATRRAFLALLLATAPAWGQAGALDPSFGEDGRVTLNLGSSRFERANAVVVQPDGKVVVAGGVGSSQESAFGLTRYTPDGSLDPTFGAGGRAAGISISGGGAYAVALQPDGKIVVAGSALSAGSGSGSDFVLARFNPDGTSDAIFGTGGFTATAFAGYATDIARGVAVQPDGRIVVGGTSDTSSECAFALARYTADGALDPSFGIDGKARATVASISGHPCFGGGLVLQPDGRLVVSATVPGADVGLARFTASGALDATFGGDGIVVVAGSLPDHAGRTALGSDGRLYVTGSTCIENCFTSGARYAIRTVRLNADGTTNGTFLTPLGESAAGADVLATQPDGSFIVAGHVRAASGYDFALVRYTSTGTLDPSFGNDGIASTDFGADDFGRALASLPDGRIRVAGYSAPTSGSSEDDFAIAGYDATGQIDPSFGTGGLVVTGEVGSGHDEGNALALQPDGRLIVAGATLADGWDFALARVEGDGQPDPTFGGGGRVVTSFGPNDDRAYAVAVQPDGKILVSGYTGYVLYSPPTQSFTVARYTSDGVLDPSFGSNGWTTVGTGAARALLVQPDGKILVAGGRGAQFIVARLTPSGDLDPTFNAGAGWTGINWAYYYNASAMSIALQPDGRVLVAGTASNGEPSPSTAFCIARLNPDGTLDPDFGDAGRVAMGSGSSGGLADLVLQPDGRVIIGGNYSNYDYYGSVNYRMLVRYDDHGEPDPSFGEDGVARHDGYGLAAIVLQPDGRIVAAGYGNVDFGLTRHTADGAMDLSFGEGGYVVTDFYQGQDRANDAALLPNGLVVAAGTATRGGNGDFALARYHTSPGVPNEPAPPPLARSLIVTPNPAAGSAVVQISLPARDEAHVAIYNVLGREVVTLHDGPLDAGEHRLPLDTSVFPPGVYFVRAAARAWTATGRMTIAR